MEARNNKGLAEGRAESFAEGRAKGRLEGMNEVNRENACKMNELGMAADAISQAMAIDYLGNNYSKRMKLNNEYKDAFIGMEFQNSLLFLA